jgi:hypothetical protein
MRRDKRWKELIKGCYCGDCWTFWPGLTPEDACPDGCGQGLHPEIDQRVEAVQL